MFTSCKAYEGKNVCLKYVCLYYKQHNVFLHTANNTCTTVPIPLNNTMFCHTIGKSPRTQVLIDERALTKKLLGNSYRDDDLDNGMTKRPPPSTSPSKYTGHTLVRTLCIWCSCINMIVHACARAYIFMCNVCHTQYVFNTICCGHLIKFLHIV